MIILIPVTRRSSHRRSSLWRPMPTI